MNEMVADGYIFILASRYSKYSLLLDLFVHENEGERERRKDGLY